MGPVTISPSADPNNCGGKVSCTGRGKRRKNYICNNIIVKNKTQDVIRVIRKQREGPQFMWSKWTIGDVSMISSVACPDHQYPCCCLCSQFSRGLILCHFISALVWLLLAVLAVKKTDGQLLTDERASCIRDLILQNDNRWYDCCICVFLAEWQCAAVKSCQERTAEETGMCHSPRGIRCNHFLSLPSVYAPSLL